MPTIPCSSFSPARRIRPTIWARRLQRIYKLSQTEPFLGRLVVLEDYDISLGRHIVQGVDVWFEQSAPSSRGVGHQRSESRSQRRAQLLGPRRLVGRGLRRREWLCHREWPSPRRPEHPRRTGRKSLYDVLQREVIPLFYERDADDLPLKWIARMKRAVRTLGWRFNADRMVMDYVQQTYIPAAGGLSCDMPKMSG